MYAMVQHSRKLGEVYKAKAQALGMSFCEDEDLVRSHIGKNNNWVN